jgi:DNA-binding NarL/FixJ family response regulator
VAPDVVMLTTFGSDEDLLRALRAGASGYLLKDATPAEIVAAVLKVAAGESVLSPQATRQLMDHVGAVATVKTHLTKSLAKLQLTNRVQLALLAHEAGLV